MSPAVIIAIVVGAFVVLAAVVLLTAARKSDVRGAGALSRETRRRDKDTEIDRPVSGKDIERAASSARVAVVQPAAPVEWNAPDAETIGFNRRQFLNRATVTLMSAGLGSFAAASFVAFLWPTAAPVFGGKVNVGKLGDILSTIRSNSGFFYSSSARSYLTLYPSEALPKAKGVMALATEKTIPVAGSSLPSPFAKCRKANRSKLHASPAQKARAYSSMLRLPVQFPRISPSLSIFSS